jgi:TonB family protein
VLDWHYSTGAGAAPRVQISIKFEPPASPEASSTAPRASAMVGAISPAPPDSAPRQIKSIVFSGISPEAEQELRNRLQIHEGDTVSSADMQRIVRTVQEYDSHMTATFMMRLAANDHEADLRVFVLPQGNGSGPLPVRVPPPSNVQTVPATPVPAGAIRVGSELQGSKIVSKTTPVYPPLAKQARIQGIVKFSATIAKDGTIENLTLISGHPLLVQAAQDAVKQWVYQPTLLNGEPVAVITEIDVNFTLSQ